MSRRVRALSSAIVALLLTGLAPPPALAAGEDWQLLVGTGSLVDADGTLKSQIPALTSAGSRFSPDGTALALPVGSECLDEDCTEFVGFVAVQHADGTRERLAGIPYLDIEAVAWAPDGSRVAVLGQHFEPGFLERRIYLVPVDGSPATLVYDDTPTLRIEPFDGLSWRSSDDTLAFVANEMVYVEGQYYGTAENSDQVWTIPAQASATPSRFTGRPSCQGCDTFPAYRDPQWSPDGSRLAVHSTEGASSFVGYLSQGDLAADPVASSVSGGPIGWSSDGGELAFTVPDVDDPEDFYADTRVVDSGSGATVATVSGLADQFIDTLPCPGGTCPVWEDVYVAPVPFMNLRGVARKGKVVAIGELGRVEMVESVTVTLSRRTRPGARWRRVSTVEAEAVEGLFRTAFDRPRAVQCRVRAVLDRDPRASDSDVFGC